MWNRVAAFESASTRTTTPASGETTQKAPCPYTTRVGSLPTATSAMALSDLALIRASEFPRISTGSARDDALPRHPVASAQVARTTEPRCVMRVALNEERQRDRLDARPVMNERPVESNAASLISS